RNQQYQSQNQQRRKYQSRYYVNARPPRLKIPLPGFLRLNPESPAQHASKNLPPGRALSWWLPMDLRGADFHKASLPMSKTYRELSTCRESSTYKESSSTGASQRSASFSSMPLRCA